MEVKAEPLKRMHIRNADGKPDTVVIEMETAAGSRFYTIDVTDLDKVISLFRGRALRPEDPGITKLQ